MHVTVAIAGTVEQIVMSLVTIVVLLIVLITALMTNINYMGLKR